MTKPSRPAKKTPQMVNRKGDATSQSSTPDPAVSDKNDDPEDAGATILVEASDVANDEKTMQALAYLQSKFGDQGPSGSSQLNGVTLSLSESGTSMMIKLNKQSLMFRNSSDAVRGFSVDSVDSPAVSVHPGTTAPDHSEVSSGNAPKAFREGSNGSTFAYMTTGREYLISLPNDVAVQRGYRFSMDNGRSAETTDKMLKEMTKHPTDDSSYVMINDGQGYYSVDSTEANQFLGLLSRYSLENNKGRAPQLNMGQDNCTTSYPYRPLQVHIPVDISRGAKPLPMDTAREVKPLSIQPVFETLGSLLYDASDNNRTTDHGVDDDGLRHHSNGWRIIRTRSDEELVMERAKLRERMEREKRSTMRFEDSSTSRVSSEREELLGLRERKSKSSESTSSSRGRSESNVDGRADDSRRMYMETESRENLRDPRDRSRLGRDGRNTASSYDGRRNSIDHVSPSYSRDSGESHDYMSLPELVKLLSCDADVEREVQPTPSEQMTNVPSTSEQAHCVDSLSDFDLSTLPQYKLDANILSRFVHFSQKFRKELKDSYREINSMTKKFEKYAKARADKTNDIEKPEDGTKQEGDSQDSQSDNLKNGCFLM